MAREEKLSTRKTKVCEKCGRRLPLTEFYEMTSNPDGHSKCCKACNMSSRTPSLSDFTEQQLYDELVRRGFTGKMIKTITLTSKK